MAHCVLCKGAIATKRDDVCSACQSMFNDAVVHYEGYCPAWIGGWIGLTLHCTDGVTRFLEFDITGMKIKPASGAIKNSA